MDTAQAWDKLIEMGVSEETLQVVTDICGYSLGTLEGVLYSVSGYEDFEQLEEDE